MIQLAAEPQGGGMVNLIMMGAIVIVFYFFMIRPQMKKAKEQKKYIEALKKEIKYLPLVVSMEKLLKFVKTPLLLWKWKMEAA